MSEPSQPRCPRCGTGVEPTQEYCLECGARLEHETPGPVERAAATVTARHPWARPWVVPALLGLVVAVLGAGAAIAISGERDPAAAPSTATGGSLTVTDEVATLTAPDATIPTTTTATPATTAAPTTTAPKPPGNPPATWPARRRGWTIVLLSLPQANGRAAAEKRAEEARSGGLQQVGVLDSSRFASLHPGYFVVFTGIYGTEAEAASALQRARAVFRAAYQRQIVP